MAAAPTERTHIVHYVAEPCCRRCESEMHIHFDCPACDMTDAPSDAYHHIGMNDLFTCRNCGARFHVVEAPATGTQIEISAARE